MDLFRRFDRRVSVNCRRIEFHRRVAAPDDRPRIVQRYRSHVVAHAPTAVEQAGHAVVVFRPPTPDGHCTPVDTTVLACSTIAPLIQQVVQRRADQYVAEDFAWHVRSRVYSVDLRREFLLAPMWSSPFETLGIDPDADRRGRESFLSAGASARPPGAASGRKLGSSGPSAQSVRGVFDVAVFVRRPASERSAPERSIPSVLKHTRQMSRIFLRLLWGTTEISVSTPICSCKYSWLYSDDNYMIKEGSVRCVNRLWT